MRLNCGLFLQQRQELRHEQRQELHMRAVTYFVEGSHFHFAVLPKKSTRALRKAGWEIRQVSLSSVNESADRWFLANGFDPRPPEELREWCYCHVNALS